MDGVLESPAQVRCCLERLRHLYQPATTSLLQIGAFPRRGRPTEIFHPGFIDELDERTELGRRLRCLEDRDRTILMLWHVAGVPPGEVARRVGVSRRQHRRRLRVTPFRCPCAARSGISPASSTASRAWCSARRDEAPPGEVMFNVHLDTVAGGASPSFDGGRFLGRGAIDAKGPAVALLAGMRTAAEAEPGIADGSSVLIQAVAGEEGGA